MPVVHVEDPTLHRVVKLGSFEGTKVLLEGKAALFMKQHGSTAVTGAFNGAPHVVLDLDRWM